MSISFFFFVSQATMQSWQFRRKTNSAMGEAQKLLCMKETQRYRSIWDFCIRRGKPVAPSSTPAAPAFCTKTAGSPRHRIQLIALAVCFIIFWVKTNLITETYKQGYTIYYAKLLFTKVTTITRVFQTKYDIQCSTKCYVPPLKSLI